MDEKSSSTDLASPCVRNCCLDEEDICIGCGRSLEEICGWSKVDDAGKARILALAETRRAARVLIR